MGCNTTHHSTVATAPGVCGFRLTWHVDIAAVRLPYLYRDRVGTTASMCHTYQDSHRSSCHFNVKQVSPPLEQLHQPTKFIKRFNISEGTFSKNNSVFTQNHVLLHMYNLEGKMSQGKWTATVCDSTTNEITKLMEEKRKRRSK